MVKDNVQVPFGYEPPAAERGGTLIVYGDFMEIQARELIETLQYADRRSFKDMVLYPIHEETGKRMGLPRLPPYYQRVEGLEEALDEALEQTGVSLNVTIDRREGKRKKYTPIDTALQFLTDKHRGPFFIVMAEHIAVKWAEYASFSQWIRKVRLVIPSPCGCRMPPLMEQFKNRWQYL